MVLKLPGAEKQMFWAFEESIFRFFDRYKTVRQSIQNYLKQNLVIGTFLENGFEATWSPKTNVLSVWRGHFSVFCKFLSDEVKTLFQDCEGKRLKLFKSKSGHKKLLRKWFWRYRELKNEFSERLKRAFFSFMQIFEWRSSNPFLGNSR